jgi:hypothetical protein
VAFVAFVALCGTLWHFVAFCTFCILLDPFGPFGSFCVLVTDTSLNVSFSISVVAKYQIQNRDFSKCQFVPKMTKTSYRSLYNECPSGMIKCDLGS